MLLYDHESFFFFGDSIRGHKTTTFSSASIVDDYTYDNDQQEQQYHRALKGDSGGGGNSDGTSPCGSIQCADTPEPVRPTVECPSELASLENCLRSNEDGATYGANFNRQTWWYVCSFY